MFLPRQSCSILSFLLGDGYIGIKPIMTIVILDSQKGKQVFSATGEQNDLSYWGKCSKANFPKNQGPTL